MKLLTIYFFILICLLHAVSDEYVRVNIVGYTKLDKFRIILNDRSVLILNGKSSNCKSMELIPGVAKVICDGKDLLDISRMEIKSQGEIVFNSFAGDQEYEGDFTIEPFEESIRITNTVAINAYFASVLGSEMGGGFSDEALKASAVAIRTYYYKRKKNYSDRGYDINNADGIDMVYRGSSFATKRMYEAFNKTENLFLVDRKDNLVLPLFHSTSGGIILKDVVMKSGINDDITDPVLTRDVDDTGTPLSYNSPYFKFSETIDMTALMKIISFKIRIRAVKSVKLKYFNGTKCVDFIGFVHPDDQTSWIKAYEFISLCQRNGFHDLRSIQFSVDKIGERFFFKGFGFGHLCGMSQYSAEALAKKGYDFVKILAKYYPDYTVKKIPSFPDLF